jgi:CRAL/TRIO domain
LTYLAYTLERAAAQSAAAGGDGRFVLIIDYAAGEFSLRRAPSLSTSKATLALIQDCYPERLAAAFMFDSPSIFLPMFRCIRPFIDPVTFAKSKFSLPHSCSNFQKCLASATDL